YTREIFRRVGAHVPRIHFATGNPALTPLFAETRADVVSVDWREPLDDAWARIGDRGIQGNLDPALCLAPFEVVSAGARDVLRRAAGRPGHAFNLGHRVAAGMRFSEPSIARAAAALVAGGADRVAGIVLSPQWSDLLMCGYVRALDEALGDVPHRVARSWSAEPLFIESLAGRVSEAL